MPRYVRDRQDLQYTTEEVVLRARISLSLKHLPPSLEQTFRPHPAFLVSPHLLGIHDPLPSPEEYLTSTFLPHVHRALPGIIIDVGANVGQFAVSIAEQGLDGISYEPTPDTCAKLRRKLDAAQTAHIESKYPFGNITVHCAAVGGEAGRAYLKRTGDSAAARLGGDALDIAIPVVTLDETVPPHASVLLLKTDTQGFELGVLRGADRTLRAARPRVLLIECSAHLLATASGRSSPSYHDKVHAVIELLQTVASYGYACTHLGVFRPFDSHLAGGKIGHMFKKGPLPGAITDTVTFAQLAAAISCMLPTNRSGWTDLLCWPMG